MIAILTLSNIYIPKASAVENYFTAEGSTLELDEIDPTEQDPLVSVKIKAAREMTVHSLHGYFTPVDSEDAELRYYRSWMDYVFPGMSHICYSMEDGEFDWNTEGCEDDNIGVEGIHVQAGDSIMEATYVVKDGVDVLKRNMPARIELGVVDDGAETGKRIENVTMDAYVRAGHNLSVWKYITGNGNLDVPNIVIGGTDVEVGVVPDPGYELTYLELNGQEITDQVKNSTYMMTAGTESLTFYATFQRIYHVLEGDGGEHIAGSEGALSFKVDNDVTEFCGQGLLIIDGEYLDMRYKCVVDPDNQTIVLPASYLNTLGLGEHSFEAYFSEPESGSAKASFKIIEESDDDDDNNGGQSENKNEGTSVPNTGASTGEYGSAEVTAGDIIPFAVIAGFIVVAGILTRKVKQG